jgi:hypothetical protein
MITALNVGTVLGPHVMRDGERPARVGTPCCAKNCRWTPPTSVNALPPFPGGQVVAGSNPVSPTKVCAGQGYFGHPKYRQTRAVDTISDTSQRVSPTGPTGRRWSRR